MTNETFPTVEELEAQERELVLPRADLAALYALGRRMADDALAKGLPVMIQVRANGRLVFAAGLPGSDGTNNRWAERKARLTDLFGQASLLVRLRHQRDGKDALVAHSLPEAEFAAHGGAVPLRVAGSGVIGSVVVSGLPQVQDHEFAVAHLRAVIAEG